MNLTPRPPLNLTERSRPLLRLSKLSNNASLYQCGAVMGPEQLIRKVENKHLYRTNQDALYDTVYDLLCNGALEKAERYAVSNAELIASKAAQKFGMCNMFEERFLEHRQGMFFFLKLKDADFSKAFYQECTTMKFPVLDSRGYVAVQGFSKGIMFCSSSFRGIKSLENTLDKFLDCAYRYKNKLGTADGQLPPEIKN